MKLLNRLYINEAINKGYDVEVDVRFEKNKFFLGHDKNQFEISKDFLGPIMQVPPAYSALKFNGVPSMLYETQ